MINIGIKTMILTAAVLLAPAFRIQAAETGLDVLIRNALENNADIAAAGLDAASERMSYESAAAGALPKFSFSSDTGNNPLYRYSDADEFSADTFTSERFKRHRFGGGINLGAELPTGGSLSLTGAGSLELALADADDAEWNYLLSPAVSLFLRQPLFIDRINGSPIRFDSLKLADELASAGPAQAELNRTALENNLIILIARTSVVLNSLRNSYSILERRIGLAEKRLGLALQDEEAGRLSSLDRLSEELQIRRLRESIIELAFQIESAEGDLEQLTGGELSPESYVSLAAVNTVPFSQLDYSSSFNVRNSAAAARNIELSGTVVQNGSEPVFEVSALYRRSDTDAAAALDEAFNEAGSAEMDLSVSLSLSFPLIDWGEMRKKREADRQSLAAAGERLESVLEAAKLAEAAAMRNLKLIEEKIILIEQGLEYDRTLLQRETVRLEAGLSSDAAVETIELDLLEREYSINQLQDERVLAILELYNTLGTELKSFFTGD